MLRHATGFKLANDGVDTRAIQDYLAHKSIAQYGAVFKTVARSKPFRWKDEPKAIQEK